MGIMWGQDGWQFFVVDYGQVGCVVGLVMVVGYYDEDWLVYVLYQVIGQYWVVVDDGIVFVFVWNIGSGEDGMYIGGSFDFFQVDVVYLCMGFL